MVCFSERYLCVGKWWYRYLFSVQCKGGFSCVSENAVHGQESWGKRVKKVEVIFL